MRKLVLQCDQFCSVWIYDGSFIVSFSDGERWFTEMEGAVMFALLVVKVGMDSDNEYHHRAKQNLIKFMYTDLEMKPRLVG